MPTVPSIIIIMVLEFLLIKVREGGAFSSLKHRGYVYKLRAFADNVVFILEDLIITLPLLIYKIKEFRDLAGFYLNQNISKLLPKKYVQE